MHHLPNHCSPLPFLCLLVSSLVSCYYQNVKLLVNMRYNVSTPLTFCSSLLFPLPVIPLKSELAYKILERGRMRFWLQAEEISPKVTYKFFANNKELSGADVR